MDVEDLSRIREALLPRYEVEDVVGHGGMATVYRARDSESGSLVAIKILRPELATIGVERFLREIDVTASLEHPNVLPVLDSGRAGELPYLVMPYLEIPSLRDRLLEQPQLPIEEAVDIVRQVAEALSVAHARGIVHRDIKPSNIFVGEGRVLLTDFGIARLVEEIGEERLTDSGIAVGTPGYMSPEQIGAEHRIDGRSDIYSVGCVLYEMLAGEPPFTGKTRPAIFAKQVSLPPPSVSTLRHTVPPDLEDVLRRALAKTPADRFRTVEELAAALESARLDEEGSFGTAEPNRASRRLAALVASVALVGAGVVAWRALGSQPVPIDEGTYVVLPFASDPGVEADASVGQLRDLLSRWTDVSVVDERRVRQRIGAGDASDVSPAVAARIARELGAAWYVRGSLSPAGDSVRLLMTLGDARAEGQAMTRDRSVRVASTGPIGDSTLASTLDRLLSGDLPPPVERRLTTTSLTARRVFLEGEAALRRWELDTADSLFTAASAIDPAFAEAHLWSAVARWWDGQETPLWRIAAQQAATGRAFMTARERSISEAMSARARDDAVEACALWEGLTDAFPFDFAAWYGTASCLAADNVVVRDPASPSGWGFRTSYHHALDAYERAFQLQPSILSSFREDSYAALLRLLRAGGNERRAGLSEGPEEATFVADPAWQGDSLALVPYPMSEAMSSLTTTPARVLQAVRNQRELFRDIALSWVRTSPNSVDARRALAISLGMLGDATALDSLGVARDVAQTPEGLRSVRISEIWMRLSFALPDDLASIRRVKALADSVLDDVPGHDDRVVEPWELAAVAAVTGRAEEAARLSDHPSVRRPLQIALPLRTAPARLLVLSAFGGPADSLRALEDRVRESIATQLPPPDREGAVRRWVVRPATLAFPRHRFDAYSELTVEGDYLWNLQLALIQNDVGRVRREIESIERIREEMSAAVTLDALYPEAAVLMAVGDFERAADWLDPTLASLPRLSPNAIAQPHLAASLVHTMMLRARIADELGDERTARGWARAVTILWSDADSFLQPLVAEARGLAG